MTRAVIDSINKSLKTYRKYTCMLCVLGFVISSYAVWVELEKERNPDYKAMCDITEHVSCSVVLTSKYGKGFGVLGHLFGEESIVNQPNAAFGMIFYVALFLFGMLSFKSIAKIQLFLTIISNMMSVYLAFILYYILHDLCLVCCSVYVINFILLIFSSLKLRTLNQYEDLLVSINYSRALDGRSTIKKTA